MAGGLGVSSLFCTLFLFSRGMASVDVGRPELAEPPCLCNSIGVLLFCLPRIGGLWCLCIVDREGGGVGSVFVCIITSLASGDVMFVPIFVIVDWICGVENSFVRSKWPWGAGVEPVCCSVIWI